MTQLTSVVGTGVSKKLGTVAISSYFQKSPQNKTTATATTDSTASSQSTATSEVTSETTSELPVTSNTNTSEEPKNKIKNIIKNSGPKLTRKKKVAKNIKEKNSTLKHSGRTSNVLCLLSRGETSETQDKGQRLQDLKNDLEENKISDGLEEEMETRDPEIEETEPKDRETSDDNQYDDVDVFSWSSSEDIPSLKINSDKLTSISKIEKESDNVILKSNADTTYLPQSKPSIRLKMDHFDDPYEFTETDSKEELDLEDKIKKLKSSVTKTTESDSLILEVKIQKLKSCVKINDNSSDDDFCEDMRNQKKNYSKDCAVSLSKVSIFDTDRLDKKGDLTLDNPDSDCPDSSTPVVLKTKSKLPCPRISNIYQPSQELVIPSTSKSAADQLISNLTSNAQNFDKSDPKNTVGEYPSSKSSTSESVQEEIQKCDKNSIKQTVLPQRKTRRIPIADFEPELEGDTDLPNINFTKKGRLKRKQPDTKTTSKCKKPRNTDIFSYSTCRAEKSILDYFSKMSPAKSKLTPTDIEREAMEVKEDFDVKLIEELSDFPKIKEEGNIELQREILKLDNIMDLNTAQIRMLVLNSEKYLRDIFQGKVACERHQDYKRGGKDRNNLNYQVHLDLYTEEQQEVVMETLMEIFCKKHHKYLDYLLKVLFPEILIKIYMEVKGTTYSQTVDIMNNPPD